LGWEGGFRAPFLIRWPGTIPAGRVLNGIFSLEDVVPTVMAAAGIPDVKEQLRKGYQAGAKRFHVHLDGYNQLPYLIGQTEESSRSEFFYYGEHERYAIRYRS
jgi:arylsulfatase A-like enzyme